jgi:hypothetical protein
VSPLGADGYVMDRDVNQLAHLPVPGELAVGEALALSTDDENRRLVGLVNDRVQGGPDQRLKGSRGSPDHVDALSTVGDEAPVGLVADGLRHYGPRFAEDKAR